MDSSFLEKPLPFAEEAERVILGSVLLDGRVMADVAAGVAVEDLYSPFHKRVLAAMLELYNAKKPIDPVMIGEEMKRHAPLENPAAIANLSFGVPYFTNVEEYITIVREKAQLRGLIRRCDEIIKRAMDEAESAESVLTHAQTAVNAICTADDRSDKFVPLAQIIHHEVLPGLDSLLGGQTAKISTGMPKVDAMIGGGLSATDILLMAGLPGSGKSALALQMLFEIAKGGTPGAFIAGEMSNRENVNRLLSQVSGMVNLNSLTHINDQDHKFLTEWAMAVKDVPLYFECKTFDLRSMAPYLRRLVSEKGVRVIVVDYVQLFQLDRYSRLQRNERIAEASQEVKRLAMELGIAVIEVAQFNREGAKAMKATMYDLEGSGQLEKDASLIFIIDRDEADKHRVTIRIEKGRNTGLGTIEGVFKGYCLKFEF